MASFIRNTKTPTSLVEHLAEKGAELRLSEESHAEAAKTHAELAAQQKQASKTAAVQATAVERAWQILSEADVQL